MTLPRLWRRLAILSAAVLAALAVSVPAGAQPETSLLPQPRFGVVEPQDAPAQASDLGVGWGRVRFHWGSIQPDGPDQWIEAEISDAQIAAEQEAGREIVGLLIGVPGWAQDAQGLPRGLALPPDDPGNLWAVFVRQAVTRYAGRIDRWIIWNEPDVWDADHPAFAWPGSIEDYVRLLKVAYLTARAANPGAVIHLAATSHWWDVEHGRDPTFPQLLDAILADPDAAANNYFYDVATLHLYFNPASVYEIAQEYRGYQAERGLDKPFWLVETNAAPSSDPAWPVDPVTFRVSLLEQAAYLPQALALALAAGMERVAVYKLIDTPGDVLANPEPFGLLRADGSPRPAFAATRAAIDLLADAERVTWNEQGTASQVVVEKPGAVVRLLWSRVDYALVAEVPALTGSGLLIDMWGNSAPTIPADGVYRLGLYAGECQETVGDYCMIGGPPIALVETFAPGGDPLAGDDLPGVLAVEPMPPLTGDEQGQQAAPGRWLVIGGVLVVLAASELLLRRRLLRRTRTDEEK